MDFDCLLAGSTSNTIQTQDSSSADVPTLVWRVPSHRRAPGGHIRPSNDLDLRHEPVQRLFPFVRCGQ